MEKQLEQTIASIRPLDQNAMEAMQKHLDSLTKPLGSLGRLEDLAKQLSGIYATPRFEIPRKTVIVMAADNGVVDEGVSSCPKDVTVKMTENFAKGFCGINVFTQFVGAGITVVDIGVDAELSSSGIVNKKIMRGTENMAKGPAMTREQAVKAIETGIEVVANEVGKGAKAIGTGEMGIGNTTTSSAVLAVLGGYDCGLVTGRGAGLSDQALENKIRVIEKAIELNNPDPSDVVDVLSKVGGLDIAGLVGVFLGGAALRVPVVIDGFISGVAALAAYHMCPLAKEYMVPSHMSAEPGTQCLFKSLGLEPPFHLGMRLGEGTGTALAFGLMDLAVKVVKEMGSFYDAGIEQYVPQSWISEA